MAISCVLQLKPFAALCVVPFHQRREFKDGKMLQQLIEQTHCL
ncbi:MAG TPA: hypothetical protein VG345_00465 [Bryobacteraceae bacterium]|nr:hypothetical protein [Bryobacteraceae bacterium]